MAVVDLRVGNWLEVKHRLFANITRFSIGIHVINFKGASGRFFFHFLEFFEKYIEYIRKFFIHFLEISKFW